MLKDVETSQGMAQDAAVAALHGKDTRVDGGRNVGDSAVAVAEAKIFGAAERTGRAVGVMIEVGENASWMETVPTIGSNEMKGMFQRLHADAAIASIRI